jgi:hypothetical protein
MAELIKYTTAVSERPTAVNVNVQKIIPIHVIGMNSIETARFVQTQHLKTTF